MRLGGPKLREAEAQGFSRRPGVPGARLPVLLRESGKGSSHRWLPPCLTRAERPHSHLLHPGSPAQSGSVLGVDQEELGVSPGLLAP